MADQYFLRWNNHQPNFITVFKDLLDLEELVDVTLSVEGKHIKAHKVILSACSQYFKILFTTTPCKHPVVIFSDMKYSDLKIIIDFIYCGEVNVSDDQLADILEVAETLQIRGLYDPKNRTSSDLSHERNGPSSKKRKKKPDSKMNSDLQGDDYSLSLESFENMIPTTSMDDMDQPNGLGEMVLNIDQHLEFQTDNFCQEDEGPSRITDQKELQFNDQLLSQPLDPNSQQITKSSSGRRRGSIRVQDSENFVLALEAVRTGRLGFCKAAKLYGLNNRTLWLEYKRRGYPTYRPPVVRKPKLKEVEPS